MALERVAGEVARVAEGRDQASGKPSLLERRKEMVNSGARRKMKGKGSTSELDDDDGERGGGRGC